MASLSRTARRPFRPGSPSGYVINANGRLIKANYRFIKVNGYFIKTGFSKPATAIYQGQPQWQLQIYQSQLQPEGPTLRSSSRRLEFLDSNAENRPVGAPKARFYESAKCLGPARAGSQIALCKDYLKKAGHRFRQGQPQWLFHQSQPFSSAPMAKGGAMAALSSPNGHFIKASPVWPFCQEQPNCNFIKASPNGNFIKNGKLIKDSPKATSPRQPQWLFYQGKWPSHQSQLPLYQSQWQFYQSRLLKRPRQFIKASPSGNFMMVAAGRASP